MALRKEPLELIYWSNKQSEPDKRATLNEPLEERTVNLDTLKIHTI